MELFSLLSLQSVKMLTGKSGRPQHLLNTKARFVGLLKAGIVLAVTTQPKKELLTFAEEQINRSVNRIKVYICLFTESTLHACLFKLWKSLTRLRGCVWNFCLSVYLTRLLYQRRNFSVCIVIMNCQLAEKTSKRSAVVLAKSRFGHTILTTVSLGNMWLVDWQMTGQQGQLRGIITFDKR